MRAYRAYMSGSTDNLGPCMAGKHCVSFILSLAAHLLRLGPSTLGCWRYLGFRGVRRGTLEPSPAFPVSDVVAQLRPVCWPESNKPRQDVKGPSQIPKNACANMHTQTPADMHACIYVYVNLCVGILHTLFLHYILYDIYIYT